MNKIKVRILSENISEEKKLSGLNQIICAWPLVMVFLGGACGALGWMINRKIMSKKNIGWLKYPGALLGGLVAIILYLAAIFILVLIFPGMFDETTG